MSYVLSASAQRDLLRILDHYHEVASLRIVRQMTTEFVQSFRFLERNPGAGHTREDVRSKTVLFWPLRDYLIVYRATSKPLEIVMIIHGSQDIPALLNRRDLG